MVFISLQLAAEAIVSRSMPSSMRPMSRTVISPSQNSGSPRCARAARQRAGARGGIGHEIDPLAPLAREEGS